VSSRTVARMGFLLGEFRSAVTSRSGDKFIESRFTSRQRTHENGLKDTVQSDVVRLMFLIRFCAQVLESRWCFDELDYDNSVSQRARCLQETER
jgi:hypothetical protein